MALKSVESVYTTSSNGTSSARAMPRVLHLPDHIPARLWWRDWFRKWWFRLERQWEPITVKKNIDSVTMPKWIAIAILTATLGFGIQSWWRASDQRDLLIELKTELRLNKEFEAERARQQKEQADLNKVYIDNMTNQLNVIKGMLSLQQLTAVEAAKKGNN